MRHSTRIPRSADTSRTQAAAKAGEEAAWDHANEEWKKSALACLKAVADVQALVVSDDVWAAMEKWHPGLSTHENSAMGGVFTAAAAKGWITHTGRRQKSSARETNHREITIWASNLFRGRGAVEVQPCMHCEGHGSVLVERAEEPVDLGPIKSARAVPAAVVQPDPPKQRRRQASSTSARDVETLRRRKEATLARLGRGQ